MTSSLHHAHRRYSRSTLLQHRAYVTTSPTAAVKRRLWYWGILRSRPASRQHHVASTPNHEHPDPQADQLEPARSTHPNELTIRTTKFRENKPSMSDLFSERGETRRRGHRAGRSGAGPKPCVPMQALALCCVNVRSLNNKASDLQTTVCAANIDVCAITETWLADHSGATISAATPDGYELLEVHRVSRTGGGTAILCKAALKPAALKSGETDVLEFSAWRLQLKGTQLVVVVVYRPPDRSISKFFSDLTDALEEYSAVNNLLVTGDFNLPHVADRVKLIEHCEPFNLTNRVHFATHESGNTLDLLLAREDDQVRVTNVSQGEWFSDHCFIMAELSVEKTRWQKETIEFRQWKLVDWDAFEYELQARFTAARFDEVTDVTRLAAMYDSVLLDTVNMLAPLKTRVKTIRPSNAWYTTELQDLKSVMSRAERKFRKDRNACACTVEESKARFKSSRANYRAALRDARGAHYASKARECAGDQRRLFQLVSDLTGDVKATPVPPCSADDMAKFFMEKIAAINAKLEDLRADPGVLSVTPESVLHNEFQLERFCEVSEHEITQLIMQAPNKQCQLDPCPIWVLKKAVYVLAPIVTKIVNRCLSSGDVPSTWKCALVKPLLKKPGLDLRPQNFRPVSNLPWIAKLVERVVVKQLTEFAVSTGVMPAANSAYRRDHSTETALLKVQSDMLEAMDKQQLGLIVLLDNSAAFATISHPLLLRTLRALGVAGTCLKWISSYLSGREQVVQVRGQLSQPTALTHGVPQGSCLGPLLFVLGLAPLYRIVEKFRNVSVHGYADDHQVEITFQTGAQAQRAAALELEQSVSVIRQWFIAHNLLLNDAKTELLAVGSPVQIQKLAIHELCVGVSVVHPVSQVRNLGFTMRSDMSAAGHIATTCRKAQFHLRRLRPLVRILDKDVLASVVHAFITSGIDYCNGLLAGAPKYQVRKLQLLQNCAARLLRRPAQRGLHTVELLEQLHWLPVANRIAFKIAVLVRKCLNGTGPRYLRAALSLHSSTRLRSGRLRLQPPRVRNITHGGRAFPAVAERVWNALPEELRVTKTLDTFKKSLKTHFFVTA